MKGIVALILMMALSLSCSVNVFVSGNNLTTLNLDEGIQKETPHSCVSLYNYAAA